MAKAKVSVKIIKGRIESFAAAETGFVGTKATRKSRIGGCSATAGTVVRADRRAAALSAGIGQSDNRAGVNTAPMMAESNMRHTIQVTVRAAIGPARAASALFTIPVMRSATTSGTTVIRNPLSQSEPTISSQYAICVPMAGTSPAAKIPRASPMTSARRMRVAFDIASGLASPSLPMQGRGGAARKNQ